MKTDFSLHMVLCAGLLLTFLAAVKPVRLAAQAPATPSAAKPAAAAADKSAKPAETELPPEMFYPTHAPRLKRLGPDIEAWVDPQRRCVLMRGKVCLRQGQLEMFACLQGTKEHESVVALNTQAYPIHAALLALGAEPGRPVQFRPTFRPAQGPEVEVTVFWIDPEGKRHRARAQDWVRDVKANRAMEQKWIFAGSGFWRDEQTGKEHYQAEEGDFICVSNFGSAMLDLPVESSQANNQLLFEAFTERIPARGTEVTVVLTPTIKKPAAPARTPASLPRPTSPAKTN